MTPPRPAATRAPPTGACSIVSQKFPGGGLVLPPRPGPAALPHTRRPCTPGLAHGGLETPPAPQPRAPPGATTTTTTIGPLGTPELVHGGPQPSPRPRPLAPPPARPSSTGGSLMPESFHGGLELPPIRCKPRRFRGGAEPPPTQRQPLRPLGGTEPPPPASRGRLQPHIGGIGHHPPPAPRKRQISIGDTEPPPPSITAPPPEQAQSPSAAIRITDKYLCSVLGATISLCMVYYPLIYYVNTGNFEETISLWNLTGIEIGLANALIWLLHSSSVLTRDKTYDILLTSGIFIGANLTFLLTICGHQGRKRRAWAWFTSTMAFVFASLFIIQLEPTVHTVVLLERTFGVIGVILLGVCHFYQIYDLHHATEKLQLKTVLATIVPSFVFALVQGFVTFSSHTNQLFMMIQCGINLICYPIEMIIATKMYDTMEKESKKLMIKISSSKHLIQKLRTSMRKTSISGSRNKQYDDEESLKHSTQEHTKEAELEEIIHFGASSQSVDIFSKINSVNHLIILRPIIQSLSYLRYFRGDFLAEPVSLISTVDNLSISKTLHEIFSAWQINDDHLTDALLTSVKTSLCGILDGTCEYNMAGSNFASEVVAAILIGLHMSETRFSFNEHTGRNVLNPITCGDCICPTHNNFGIKFDVRMSCSCGSCCDDDQYQYTTLFHKLDAGSLKTNKIKSFAQLPVILDEQFREDSKCEHCGSRKDIDLVLSDRPNIFTIVLSWLGCNENKESLSELMAGIAYPVDTEFFCGTAGSSTIYAVSSMICYGDDRYVCFARSEEKWLVYDSQKVETEDCWEHVLERFKDSKLQPEVLFFEVIK